MFRERSKLSVAALIEALTKMPPDVSVQVEGCDCYQFADRVRLGESGDVLIEHDPDDSR